VSELTTLSRSEFQKVSAATEKARLTKTVRVRGTASLGAWRDRSGREETCGASIDCVYMCITCVSILLSDLELKNLLVNASELVSEVAQNLSLPDRSIRAVLSSKLNFTEVNK